MTDIGRALMGRPSNKEQRRKEITNALLTVMARSGFENASIQAISKEAGLTGGLVHYHFKNKQEILVELIKVLHETAQTRYIELKSNVESAEDKLAAFVDSALALGKGSNTDAVKAWVVIGAEAIKQDLVRKLYQEAIEFNLNELNELIEMYAQETGKSISSESINNISAGVIGAIEGAYMLASTAPDVIPKDYAAATVKSMLFRTLENI